MRGNKKILVEYSKESTKDLKRIDPKQASKIVNKIYEYTQIDPLQKAKKLKGKYKGSYRYRSSYFLCKRFTNHPLKLLKYTYKYSVF